MRSNTFRALFIICLACIAVSGCAGVFSSPDNHPYYSGTATMEDIDRKLVDGPVFLEFGAEWCQYCQDEKPVIENLSKKYDRVSFIEINSDQDLRMAASFMVSGIPQMDIIVRKNADGSYLYVGPDGNTTPDLQASRIIGFTGQEDLEKLMDVAIRARDRG